MDIPRKQDPRDRLEQAPHSAPLTGQRCDEHKWRIAAVFVSLLFDFAHVDHADRAREVASPVGARAAMFASLREAAGDGP